jgi:uncharacterized membrane protein YagU involved in acid resistance
MGAAICSPPLSLRSTQMNEKRNSETHAAIVGAVAGVVGAWTMNLLMSAVARATVGTSAGDPQRNKRKMARRIEGSRERLDPTGHLAEVVSITVLRHKLNEREKRIAGPAVHYAFGALAGAAYAVAAEHRPEIASGYGSAFGVGLWAAGDEIAVPALRLAPAPWKQPLRDHAAMLGAHIVYAVTLEILRRMLIEEA